jgi:hypothetical protein
MTRALNQCKNSSIHPNRTHGGRFQSDPASRMVLYSLPHLAS